MHRFRSWTLDPPEWRTQRNRILAVEGGDGSALSLDFTTGILDPRLTFTRTTNATFINSQGYVQYALANMQPNTTFDGISGTTYAVGWGGFVGTGASFERLSSGVLKCKAATSGSVANSNRAFLSTTATIPIGLPTTFKVTIQDKVVSSSLDILNFVDFVSATTSYKQYRVNGVPQTTSYNSIAIGDVITVTVIPTQATGNFRVGLGCNVNQSLNDYVTIANVMLEHGEETNSNYVFLPNSSTSLGNFNTPRFDYDPITRNSRGLLIEGSAANTVLNSESFPSTGTGQWGYTNLTPNATKITSPNGTANAIQFNETTDNALHRITQGITGSAGPASISIWAKVLDPANPRRLFLNAIGFMNASALFDLDPATQTGASGTAVSVAGTAPNRAGTWVKYPNDWYRCTVVGTYNANSSLFLQVNRASSTTPNDDTYAGSTSNGLAMWGCQVEAGSGASSYIPTGASTGNRTKDVCNITGSNFSSWFVDGPGTIVAQSDNVKSNTRNLLCEFNKDASNYIQMGVTAGAGSGEALLYNPDGFSQSGTTPSLNTAYKSAYVWDTNYFKMCLNGTLGSADTIGNIVSSGMVNLSIGGDLTNPTDVYIKNGHIRSLKYWPTRLPDAQLQTLTTG